MHLDFSHRHLNGCSFKGQNLTGADFSHADIRGADFSSAILIGANFSYSKSGIKKSWAIALLIISLFMAAIGGIGSGLAASWTANLLLSANDLFNQYGAIPYSKIAGGLSLVVLAGFLITAIHKSLESALVAVAITAIVMGSATAAIVADCVVNMGEPVVKGGEVAIVVDGAAAVSVFLAIAATWLLAVATTIVESLILPAGVALSGIIVAVILGMLAKTPIGVLVGIWIGSAIIVPFSLYISWRALNLDPRYELILKLAIILNAYGGTSFTNANLSDADFTQANLKSAVLINANLTRTNFYKAKKLSLARVGKTILIDAKVRDLVVSKNGAGKSYVGCHLKGANLTSANLCDADFTQAFISEATFEEASLERVNLTQTQALKTNFSQARLTAACLEAWNIDNTTNLEDVVCDYVYLLNDQRERRPSSGEFGFGEFTKLFQIALNTVDLIFRNGLDLETLSTALAKVKLENKNTQLAIRSIENKGDGVVVVKVEVSTDVDKAKIHNDFTQNYQIALNALELRYQEELKSKDEQINLYRQHQADLKSILQLLPPVNQSKEGKLVSLKFGEGNLSTGFSVTLQIGLEGNLPFFESSGKLPPANELYEYYNCWKTAYRHSLQGMRLEITDTQITNISRQDLFRECNQLGEKLNQHLNQWLNSEIFRPLKEQLLQHLAPSDLIRIIIQTEDYQVRRLPFQLWNFFETYSQAEVALSSIAYKRIPQSTLAKEKVKILAILGNSAEINVNKDQALLQRLPDAEVKFLVEPQRQLLNDELWQEAWDILFFAGHSSTEVDTEVGILYINQSETITIAELKNALKKAIENGLKLAIFNSCDGLGLAANLAKLHIPQIIVMREPIPDKVAQEFLKNFLHEFSGGKPLYQSLREAREKLQGLEDRFPYASWLPVICQNPAEMPPTWGELKKF